MHHKLSFLRNPRYPLPPAVKQLQTQFQQGPRWNVTDMTSVTPPIKSNMTTQPDAVFVVEPAVVVFTDYGEQGVGMGWWDGGVEMGVQTWGCIEGSLGWWWHRLWSAGCDGVVELRLWRWVCGSGCVEMAVWRWGCGARVLVWTEHGEGAVA